MSFFFSDLRFAVRSFRRQAGATGLVLLTLGLAVAANTAVFALVDAVFFRPLAYPAASRLMDINEQAPKWNLEFVGVNYPDFVAWRKASRAFEDIALWSGESVNLSDGTSAERLDGQSVTYNLASVLGIKPVLGRTFTADEDVPKGPNVIMIGHGFWQTHFAGARDVVGKTLRVSSVPYTIVGVLPPNVMLDSPTSFWIPLRGDPNQVGESYSYEGVGRVRPGVTLEQARTDLLRAHESVWRAQHDTAHVVSPRVMPLRDRLVADYKTVGAALGVGVVLVLVIACANVAGAMLARSVFRRREIGIRIALGASSSRLTRQLLTEALLLASVAGIAGTVVGRLGLGLMLAGVETPPPWLHLTIDGRAIAFSAIVVIVTTLLFGLAPMLQFRKQTSGGTLAPDGQRLTGSVPERRTLNGLVVVEIALAAVLLAAGALLVRAYRNLREVDPGFRPDGVASFRLSLPTAKYRDGLAQRRFYETLISRIQALPGVDHAGVVTCAPFTCHWGAFYAAEGATARPSNEQDPVVLTRLASSDYFATMGITLLRGRFYEAGEGTPMGPRPVVINDLLARQLWPGVEDPTGKRFSYRGDTSKRDVMTVTGVVRDVKHYGLSQPMRPGLYMSLTAIDSANDFNRFAVVAHTRGDAAALMPTLRAVVRAMDPELPLFGVQTMRAAVERSMATRRAIALWLATFSAIALTLAVGGIYAVLSYVVGRRRHEIGIRMALGAQATQVLALVVRQGLRLVIVGLVFGLPAAYFATRLLTSLLVGVRPTDPMTYLLVVVVLGATGAVAAWIPARRAARVDPKLALSDAG
jgi:putative ABC transport system permease protein